MEKFFVWFDSNRKIIGTVVGILNLFIAMLYLLQNQYGMAMLWTVVAGFILIDAYEK